jgi:hypothetical protein
MRVCMRACVRARACVCVCVCVVCVCVCSCALKSDRRGPNQYESARNGHPATRDDGYQTIHTTNCGCKMPKCSHTHMDSVAHANRNNRIRFTNTGLAGKGKEIDQRKLYVCRWRLTFTRTLTCTHAWLFRQSSGVQTFTCVANVLLRFWDPMISGSWQHCGCAVTMRGECFWNYPTMPSHKRLFSDTDSQPTRRMFGSKFAVDVKDTDTTDPELVSAEKKSPPLPSLRAHCLRFSNHVMKNRQSTCICTITVQVTDLEKLLSHGKHGNCGDCFPAETTSGPVHVCICIIKIHGFQLKIVILENHES